MICIFFEHFRKRNLPEFEFTIKDIWQAISTKLLKAHNLIFALIFFFCRYGALRLSSWSANWPNASLNMRRWPIYAVHGFIRSILALPMWLRGPVQPTQSMCWLMKIISVKSFKSFFFLQRNYRLDQFPRMSTISLWLAVAQVVLSLHRDYLKYHIGEFYLSKLVRIINTKTTNKHHKKKLFDTNIHLDVQVNSTFKLTRRKNATNEIEFFYASEKSVRKKRKRGTLNCRDADTDECAHSF